MRDQRTEPFVVAGAVAECCVDAGTFAGAFAQDEAVDRAVTVDGGATDGAVAEDLHAVHLW